MRAQAGFLGGAIAILIVSQMVIRTSILLVRAKQEVRKSHPYVVSFGDVAGAVMGRTGKIVVDLSVVLTQVGFCVGYIVFLTRTLESISSFSRIYWTILVGVVLVPLAFIRRLRLLSPFSALANFSIFLGFTSILAFASIDIQRKGAHGTLELFGSPTGIALFWSIAVSGFEGMAVILPIETSMGRDKGRFSSILTIVLVLVSVMLCAFGSVGYTAFGTDTHQIVSNNLPEASSLALGVKCVLVVAVLFTYPIQLVPVLEVLESMILNVRPTEEGNPADFDHLVAAEDSRTSGSLEAARYTLRFLCVAATAAVAFMVPDFAYVSAIVGATGGTIIAFIMPVIISARVHNRWVPIDVAIMILGSLGGAAGLFFIFAGKHVA